MSDGSFFHANRSTVKRSEGRSAVAAAAYCTGTSLYDATERTTQDYSRKRGVVEAFVATPEDKPGLAWAQDIEALSNAMEAHEKRKDSQVAHQWRIALPAIDLDAAQRSELTHEMAQALSDMYGVAVIAGIHEPDAHGDQRNFHAHLLFSTRTVEEDGLGAKVTSITSPKTAAAEVTRFREVVASLTNAALEDAESDTRVSALSYAARGIDKEPTTHLGPQASGLERFGEGSDRGDINRAIIAERIAEQEKLSAAIARQFEDGPTELSLETERELARRFGDEWREVKPGHAALPEPDAEGGWRPVPPADDMDTAMQPERARVEATGSTHASSAMHRWMQAQTRAFFEFLKDESGAPERAVDNAPDPAAASAPDALPDNAQAPDAASTPEAAPSEGGESRSWVSRVWDAGRQVLAGWQQRVGGDAAERPPFTERPSFTAQVAQAPPEGTGGDDAGPGGKVEPPGPETLPREAERRAMSAFERLAASVDVYGPQPLGVTAPSAFDAVTAEPATPPPAYPHASAPEPSGPVPEP